MSPASQPEHEPDKFIDRGTEQALFEGLLRCESDARVLTIQDRSGGGKSQLLRHLRYRCQFGAEVFPVSLVALDELKLKSAHEFVTTMERAFGLVGLTFEEYSKVEQQRLDVAVAAAGPGAVGTAKVENNEGQAAGIVVEPGATAIFQGSGVPADLEERLRQRAVLAFVEDLRVHAGKRPTVLLIDAYERCDGELAHFLPAFLRRYVVDREHRMDKLVVVIAGQRVPTPMLRMALAERYGDVVVELNSLSTWGREHVEVLLTQSLDSYDEMDLDYLAAKVQGGWTPYQATQVVDAFSRGG